MNCDLEIIDDADANGRTRKRCRRCERVYPPSASRVENVFAECRMVADGPGTELHLLLRSLGAQPTATCGCAAKAAEMDRWQLEGCREHREEIIVWLKEAAYSQWITDQIRVSWAMRKEPWFRYSDPLGSLLDEAIRRAECKSQTNLT